MAKKYDLKDIGEVYSKLGEEVVVTENKELTVGDKGADVGEAPLVGDSNSEDCGCEDPEEVDVTATPEVEAPEKDEVKEEDEEIPQEALEIAQAGLNNYMAKKSKFDELFAKVISEDFGMEEQDDLNALGIDEATPDDELGEEGGDDANEEEITVTLDKDLAKTLCDLLQAAMGEEGTDDEDGDEEPSDELGSDEFSPEEDNEGAPKAHTTHVDMGDNNKVGHVDGLGGEGKGSADGGKSAGQQKHSAAVKDGKNNKVGNHAKGKAAFGDLKVQPKNKEVKAG